MTENNGSYDAHSNPDGETADDAAVRWMIRAKTEQQRAVKAEQERDECRAMHSEQMKTIARLQENPRPLTADDITDEMVVRGAEAIRGIVADALPVHGSHISRDRTATKVLLAALTPPPSRHEGAEELDMTEYTADDFNNARFATNRDGRIAVRFYHGPVTADYPWAVIGSRSTVANPCVRDSHMTNAGWVPVQENPRPLTANDYQRGEMAALAAFVGPDLSIPINALVRAIVTEVLTPPPSRPEGAEELQSLIRQAEAEGEGADDESLADYLASRLLDPTVKEQS